MPLGRLADQADLFEFTADGFDFCCAGQAQHGAQGRGVVILELFRPFDPQQGHHDERPQQTSQTVPAVFQFAVNRSSFFDQVRLFEQGQTQQHAATGHTIGRPVLHRSFLNPPHRRREPVERRSVRDARGLNGLQFISLQFISLRLGSLRLGSLRLGSLRLDELRLDELWLSDLRWNQRDIGIIHDERQRLMPIARRTKWNAFVPENALNGGRTDAKLFCDIVGAFPSLITLGDTSGERGICERFPACLTGHQTNEWKTNKTPDINKTQNPPQEFPKNQKKPREKQGGMSGHLVPEPPASGVAWGG